MWRLLLGTMGVKSLVQGLNAAATAGFEPRTVWSEVRRRNRIGHCTPYLVYMEVHTGSLIFIDWSLTGRQADPNSGHAPQTSLQWWQCCYCSDPWKKTQKEAKVDGLHGHILNESVLKSFLVSHLWLSKHVFGLGLAMVQVRENLSRYGAPKDHSFLFKNGLIVYSSNVGAWLICKVITFCNIGCAFAWNYM